MSGGAGARGPTLSAGLYADEAHVYFNSLDNVLRALNRGNGALIWKQGLPIRPAWGPLPVNDLLVVSGVGASVRAYRAQDGTPAGDFTSPAELIGPAHLHVSPKGVHSLIVTTARGALQSLQRSFEPPIVPLTVIPGEMLPLIPPSGALEDP